MGDVIKFPKKKGNANFNVEAIPVYEKDPSLEELAYDVRMRRIKESLSKIANLVNDLKEKTSYENK